MIKRKPNPKHWRCSVCGYEHQRTTRFSFTPSPHQDQEA